MALSESFNVKGMAHTNTEHALTVALNTSIRCHFSFARGFLDLGKQTERRHIRLPCFFSLKLQKKMFHDEAPSHMLDTTEARPIPVHCAAKRSLDFTWFLLRSFMGKHVDWILHVILLPGYILNMSNRHHQDIIN